MTISEMQLDIWSRQGSITQSAATYQALRNVLDRDDAPYAQRSYLTFLQGSYGNDTNIYADSDVDIVMRLDSIFYTDLSELSASDKANYETNRSPAQYSWTEFRKEVITQLVKAYGSAVQPRSKAIYVEGNGGRRDADVLPAAEFRRYFHYVSPSDQHYAEGICFWLPNGTQVVNYPKLHSANCTGKHQRTGSWFKPTVRILKNMRNAMVNQGRLAEGIAPSYFIEGMLYNVPDANFGSSYRATLVKVLNWLNGCNRADLECANEQYFLLHPTSPVTWRREQFETFLTALINFWNDGG
ncbi:hypothetical protein A0U94_14905 (plasmid) [Gluconobacter albidus]|uniref:nucleotidyltransferase domain-containing protein n=1 Tax=Gluconobacter albidus TaxID=318683 RepID=UPI00098BAFA2|nr:nucleotidyltransferase [Gluconobacter albidus]AQS92454.1 hypothetical protein A0U94_14905 [Gluconobacter albidus]